MKTTVLLISLLGVSLARAQTPALKDDVRGLATRAPAGIRIDGDLNEFRNAFCTPVEYFSFDSRTLHNRAGQFSYMWDEEAFYAALRTLDTAPANLAPDDRLWEGDAVEWYFDTRQDGNFRSTDWPKTPSPGAVHCYWTGLKGTNVQGRFCLRPGFLEAIPKIGVEVGARRTQVGMDVEFKLPWANFPGFKAAAGTVIALDAELCYSDGGPRVARSFVYGSPLSVQQPASLGKIQLVDAFEPAYWRNCGPVLAPIRCDTAWTQNTKPNVTGFMAVPPRVAGEQIGKVVFRLLNLDGEPLGNYPAEIETFESSGQFKRAVGKWPAATATPGGHLLLGIIYDRAGKELGRVAPRMVGVGMVPGY